MNNNFIKELFNKLTNDTNECGEDVISLDGITIVDEDDLIDYFKNMIISNLEWDTHYSLSNDELYNLLQTILNSMKK